MRCMQRRYRLARYAFHTACIMAVWHTWLPMADAQITWSGTGANANWATAGNWGAASPPVNNFNTGLVFAGTSLLSNTNTLTGGTATRITFNAGAGAFVIGGHAFSLTGNVANGSANLQSLSNGISLLGDATVSGASVTLSGTLTNAGANRTLTNNVAAGSLLTLGQVNLSDSNTGRTLTLAGTGNTTLAGSVRNGGSGAGGLTINSTGTTTLSGSNTYTGKTTLGAGATLRFAGSAALPAGGTIGNSSAGGTYTIQFAAGASMSSTTSILDFTANSTNATTVAFMLDGFNQTFSTFRVGQKNTVTFTSSAGSPTFAVSGTTFVGSTNSNATTQTLTPTSGVNIVLNRIVPETPNAGSSRVYTLALDGTTTGNRINGVVSDVAVGSTTSSISIVKQNAGTWTLGGSNTYTGATTVNSGMLALGNGGSLNATAVTTNNSGTFAIRQTADGTTNAIGNATFTLAAGSALDMADGFTTALSLGSNAVFAPASGTKPVITFNLSGASSDRIDVTGTASAGAAGATLAFATPTTALTAGNRTLITGGAGSTLSTNFSLASNLLVGTQGLYSLALASSATAAVVTVADDANALYWTGAGGNAWNAAANWNTGLSSGTASANAPSSTRNVAFATTNPVPGNLSTSLGADTTINSLNFLGAAPAVTVAAGNTLTINGGGITNLGSASQTVNAPVTLGANQVWSNQGSGLLTFAGAVTNAARTLTVTGPGNVAITGGLGNGAGTLTKAGTGTLTLSGLSAAAGGNFSGTTFLDNGTIVIQGTSPSFTGGLTFGSNTPGTNAANNPTTGTLDLSGASATYAGTMTVRTTTTAANCILVGASRTLTVNGDLSIGTTAQTTFHTSRLDVAGDGEFVISKSGGLVQVANSNGTNNSGVAILDMSGLATFTATLGTAGVLGTSSTFRVGDTGSGNPNQSTYVKLAAASTITAAFLGVGDNSGNAGPITLFLGSGQQTLNVNTIYLGLNNGSAQRASAAIRFDTASGSIKIRSATDPVNGAANLSMSQHASTTGGLTTTAFDVSGHAADIKLGDLLMAGRNATGAQSQSDTFNFDTGTLTVANEAILANTTGSATHQTSNTATMTLGGGAVGNGTATFTNGLSLARNAGTNGSTARTSAATLTIQGNAGYSFAVTSGTITMGSLAGSTTASNQSNATLNLLGGSLTMTGGIVAGGSGSGSASRVLNLGGGSLDMQGNAIGSASGAITANFQSGTLRNLGELNGGAALLKTTAGTLVLGGSNGYSGATTISGGVLHVPATGSIGSTSSVLIDGAGAEFRYNSATPLTAPLTLANGVVSGTGTINSGVTIGASGVLSPGNSPGRQTFASGTWAAGGSYRWEVNDWTGSAGVNFDQAVFTGGLTISSSAPNPFTISVTSLAADDTAGAVPNFNGGLTGRSFTIATGTVTGFTPAAVTLGTTAFLAANPMATNANGGFWLASNAGGDALVLTYAPSALYTLSATPTETTIYAGGSTTITGSIANSTADRTNADALRFDNLSVGSGSLSVTSGTLAAGDGTAGTMSFSTGAAGVYTFTPSVSATNVNLGTAALAGQITTGTVTVWNAAAANQITGPVTLGNVLVGGSFGTQSLSITNTAPDGAYTEVLGATASTGGQATALGSVAALAGGSTSAAISVGLGGSAFTGSAGLKTGTATIAFTSTGGPGTASLTPQLIAVSGTVLDPATALLAAGGTAVGSAWTIDLGTYNQAAGLSTPWAFDIANLLQTQDYTADLELLSFTTTQDSPAIFTDLSVAAFPALGAGAARTYSAWMSLANAGSFSKAYSLSFASAKNGQSLGGAQNVTLTVTGVVVVPEPGAVVLALVGIGLGGWSISRRRR